MTTATTARFAVTVPFPGIALADHRESLERLLTAGYTDFWTQEVRGFDALTPLAAIAPLTQRARLGAAIAGVFTRGPALLAMQAAAVADAAPGRFALGIGSSSPAIVEGWNGARFTHPYARVRDTLRFLRRALAGERIDERYESFAVRGFALERPPREPPKLLVAALRERMLRLAGEEADGAALALLGASDVARVVPLVHAGGAGKEIFLRVAVFAISDAARARALARKLIAPYLGASPYAKFHAWLGRGDETSRVQQALGAADARGARAALSDATVDALVVHGSIEACQEQLASFLAAGVTTLCIDVVASDLPWLEAQIAVRPSRAQEKEKS